MSQSPFWALDFDGVLAESLRECLVVGWNAYSQVIGRNNRCLSWNDYPKEWIPLATTLRNYIRSGKDYVYIHQILDEHIDIRSQTEFDAFCSRHQNRRTDYYHRFYREREYLFTHHRDTWLRLTPLYPGIASVLNQSNKAGRVAIVTTKEIRYVSALLRESGVRSLSPDLWFQATDRVSKETILTRLIERYDLVPRDLWFVEDQVSNLIAVKSLAIRGLFALWGYHTRQQRLLAQKEGFETLSLNRFKQQLQ